VEIELDLPPSPPPLEATLAARRAKRHAILAKFAGQGISASSGHCSAAQPAITLSADSDPSSQTQSIAVTPLSVNVNPTGAIISSSQSSFSTLFENAKF
jgi:serine/threonine-protein kinase PRP4